MRKVIIIILPLLILLFSIKVHSADADDIDKLKTEYAAKFGGTMSTSVATQIIDKWRSYDNLYLISSSAYFYIASSYSVSGSNINIVYVASNSSYLDVSGNSTISWTGSGSITFAQSASKNYGRFDEFHVVNIDWDNPYYSVAIPAPEYEVTYRNVASVGSNPDVPLNFIITPPIEGEYYCEIMSEFSMADDLTYVASQRYYDAYSYIQVQKEIVNPNQFVEPSDLNANSLYAVMNNMWQSALNELPMSDVSIKFPIDFTAEQIYAGRDTYAALRKHCTLYGSSLKFYIRYFQIVDQTKFVVGPWRIWSSYSPKSFTDELPSYYMPYTPASGNTGTSTSTSSDPNEVIIPVGGQTPTGDYYTPTFNINVGNNVPNYPDYPTIASYNLDNLLVSTMDNAKGISSFFGEFGGFLTDSFAFIPAWIWAIIGFGFSLSILVMFLKIL